MTDQELDQLMQRVLLDAIKVTAEICPVKFLTLCPLIDINIRWQ